MGVSDGVRSLLDAVRGSRGRPWLYPRGYRLRQFGWADIHPAPDALRGRRALVTGANRGIGQAVDEGPAQLGASA